jgi:hypothetical protein
MTLAAPRLCLLAAAAFVLLVAGGGPGRARPATPAQEAAAGRSEAQAFADRLVAAWDGRDKEAWLALWAFEGPGPRAEEDAFARDAFASDQTTLSLLRAPAPRPGTSRLTLDAQVFLAEEPRGRVAYWRLVAEKRAEGWRVVKREDAGQVDGLVHLSLDPSAFRVRGATLALEDFELRMDSGTLFQTIEALGPTALVFVGRGRVVFTPRPPAEREQLRQFSGSPTLDTAVRWAFVRLHPVDFTRVIDPARLEPAPGDAADRAVAERLLRERAPRSFTLDAPLPRSPWWLLPSPGDAIVDFPTGRRRVLTFALSGNESEDVNLFDRDRQLQICVYPSAGRPRQYDEDERRTVDLLEQDLTVRFEPERVELSAVHRMTLRLLQPANTLRVRLHDDLRVSSLATGEGTNLLFFRVREGNSLVVPLGAIGDRTRPFTLVTRYAGRHDPAPVEQELLQAPVTIRESDSDVFVERPPLVYSNRTAWYPRTSAEDFAPASVGLDAPEGWLAVTGGELVGIRTEDRRVRSEFRLRQPGKFVTAVVGRLGEVGLRQEGEQAVRGFATSRTRGEAAETLMLVQRLLAFYAERFGPGPYPQVGVVVAEGETPGGHSPPGLLYLQLRPPVLRLRSLPDDPANFSDLPGFFVAHEVAHQWWGQATAPASYRERWLSEAWAQYAAAMWIREKQGEGAFRGMMDRMARWAFRHDAAGPIHLGQRLGVLKNDGRIFRAVVYDKGAWVLHMLRGIVGDEAFFGGARAFLDEHRYRKAGTDDFRRALEAASGRELEPYFQRWIYETGLPTLRWSWRTEAAGPGFRTEVRLRAENLPGEVPLEVTLVTPRGREARGVRLPAGGGTFSFETVERPRRVQLNEDRALLVRLERGGEAQR